MSNTNEVSDNVEAAQRQLEMKFGSMHQAAADKPDPIDEDGEEVDGAEDSAEVVDEPPKTSDGSVGMKKDWGLDILVSVGESWIDSLLESDSATVRSRTPGAWSPAPQHGLLTGCFGLPP